MPRDRQENVTPKVFPVEKNADGPRQSRINQANSKFSTGPVAHALPPVAPE